MTSVFDASLGSEKARSSASDLISAWGAERIWSSAPYTYRDSAAGSLPWQQESGGAGGESPRVLEIDWCPHTVPIKGVRDRPWGRPVITGFGGGAEPPRDRGWERERVSNQSYALPGYVSEDATRCSGAQIVRSWWGVLKRIGPVGSSYQLGSPSLLRIRRWRGTGRRRMPGSV